MSAFLLYALNKLTKLVGYIPCQMNGEERNRNFSGNMLEICVETLESAVVAESGGADRLELCEHLLLDGLTPNPELTQRVIEAVKIPVTVLIRPRDGSFVYRAAEIEQMLAEIEFAKLAGAAGVTLGALKLDQCVNVELCREFVKAARPMEVTFHRAFDVVPNQSEALEDVILTGAERLLTSGGAPNVLEGAERIARLRKQAAGRIEIMAGGGLRLTNLLEVRKITGSTSLHGSLLSRPEVHGLHTEVALPRLPRLRVEDVREAARLVRMAVQPA